MKKKILENILIGGVFFLIYNILMFLTWANHLILLPLMLISSLIVSYFIYKNFQNQNWLKTGLTLNLPIIILFILTSIWYKDFSRSLPYILFIPFTSFLGYWYFKQKKIYIPFLSVLIIIVVSFFLFPNYFVYYQNHNAEKNIPFLNITLLNNKKEKIYLDTRKIIVLDFWSTSCGICFKKFPDLEKTYQRYKSNNEVEIYTVNVPIKGDEFNKTINILDSIGYTFPKLYAGSFKEVETKLKFNTFPHLMIIKNNKIRYDGFLVTQDESKFYNIEDEINKLLKE